MGLRRHFWILPFFAACGLAGESRVLPQPPATLTLTGDKIVGDIIHLRFSTPLRLDVVIDGDFEEADPVRVDFDENQWQIIRRRDPAPFREGGRVGWQQSVELDPLQPGGQSVRSISIRYRGRDGVRRTVEWKDLRCEIAAPVGSDEQDIRGDVDIEHPPRPPESSSALFWVIAIVTCLVAGFLGWQLLVRGRRRVLALRPEEWALRELEKLAQLPTDAIFSEGSARLSGVIREYIERRFALPAPQRTTEEFLRDMAISSDFPVTEREHLQDFLRRCDVAKFGGQGIDNADWKALLEHARAFVQVTTSAQQVG